MGGTTKRGPTGGATHQPAIDWGTLACTAMPSPGIVGGDGYEQEFEYEIDILKAEIANLGFTGAVDGAARAKYDQLAQQYRDEVRAKVKARRITWRQAAEEARLLRDDIMQQIRRRSTPVGRSVAEWLKPESPTLNQLVAKKTVELFGKEANFMRLTAEQQNRVYAAIVTSAGKSNPKITARMRLVSRAGRGLLLLSVGISVYTIATADDKVAATKHEGAVTGAGIAGGIAGGALAGLACGPGAPVCVTIGAFVGGAAAAFGVDFFW